MENKKLKLVKKYQKLNTVLLINSLTLHPPFIIYPKNTKRKGIFKESKINPFNYINNFDNLLCYPLYIGRYICYCYFDLEYASLGASLANLFTPVKREDLDKKVDLLFFYGVENKNLSEASFYHDKKNDIYLGITPNNEEMTYFGYMKKMLLTLHNLKAIDNNELPIHGAMVKIKFKNGKKSNIILVGDSGAGKSETLEALRNLLDDNISEMITIFDDMGVVDHSLKAYGTETGAFVRMDDLDNGYAYKEIDRAIFMNPDQNNARTIIPLVNYQTIIKGEKIDMILYANNYIDEEKIKIFTSVEEAIEVFKEGKRRAKKTTSEEGIVSSYFANPFGPLQNKKKMENIIEYYFKEFFSNNIKVGEIYTCLGIDGLEKTGPLRAAKELIKFIN